MSYGGGYGGGGVGLTETVRLAVESAGQGDVQQLIDLFAKLKATQGEIDAAYQQATAAAGKQAQAMKDQAKAGYEVITAYDLVEEAVGRAKTAAEKEAAATLWMDRQAKALSNTLEELAEHERTAERATVDLTAAQGKAATATTTAATQGGYGAMKWLLLSNAIQDAQYGLGAVVNNLAGVTQAFGGSAGFAGAVQIAAVALQIVISKAEAIKEFFGQGDALFGSFPDDVEGMKKKLKELTDKPNKISIDFMDIDILNDKIKQATENQREFQALVDKKTKAQVAAGKQATEAIVEQAGRGDDVAGATNLTNLLKQLIPVAVSQAQVDAAEKARVAKEYAQSGIPQRIGGANGLAVALDQQVEAEKELQSAKATDIQTRDDNIEKIITGAGRGEEVQIQKLLELVKSASADMRDQIGIGQKFIDELEQAQRSEVNKDLAGKEQSKADAAKEKARKADQAPIAKAIDESAAETNAAVREAVQSVRKGIGDQLSHQIQAMLAAGETDHAARAKARRTALSYLKDRNTPWYAESGAADELVDTAADEARNRLDTDQPSKVDQKTRQAQEKADRGAKTAANKAKAEHDRRVNEAVARTRGGYIDEATQTLYEAMQRGEDIDKVMSREQGPLSKALRDRGTIPADILSDVTRSHLKNAREQAQNALDSGVAPKLDRQADAELNKQAGRVGKSFLPALENAIAQNEYQRQRGVHEVTSDREEMQIIRAGGIMGQDYVVPEHVLHNRLGRQAAMNLQAAGEDPAMASALVHKADEKYRADYTAMFSQTGNAMQATFGVVQQTQAAIADMQQHLGNLMGTVGQLSQQVGVLRQNNTRLRHAARQHGSQLRQGEMQGPSMLSPR